jgi:hypothetical protein
VKAQPWNLVFAGAGTVGHACANALCRSPLAAGLNTATALDHDCVEPRNLVSCPGYEPFVGWHKARALMRLMGHNLPPGARPRLRAVPRRVEDVDWSELLPADCPSAVVMGLDSWSARLRTLEGIRSANDDGRPAITVSGGIDRARAAVTVYGSGWDDACPACGLASLPDSEPCILLSRQGTLVRGDLRQEAAAVAERIIAILADMLAGRGDWIDAKVNLDINDSGVTESRVRRCRSADCLGPHSANGPLRWDAAASSEPVEAGNPVQSRS